MHVTLQSYCSAVILCNVIYIYIYIYSLYRQLILIIELYSHYDVYDYLRQIALTLCSDKVSEVRWISYKLVSGFALSTLFEQRPHP